MILAIVIILATVGIYILAVKLYSRFPMPLLLPIFTSAIVIIFILDGFQIPYHVYMQGGTWINHLLGPAVVALAFPLYQEWHLVKRHFVPILGGVLTGSALAIVGMWAIASLLGIKRRMILSLLPKSVTTPVAIDVAKQIGGLPSLTVTFVMIAGIGGALIGPYLFSWLRIRHELGKGIGYGSASHAIGTSKALEDSGTTGAVSSVAMILSALVISVVLPVLFTFIT